MNWIFLSFFVNFISGNLCLWAVVDPTLRAGRRRSPIYPGPLQDQRFLPNHQCCSGYKRWSKDSTIAKGMAEPSASLCCSFWGVNFKTLKNSLKIFFEFFHFKYACYCYSYVFLIKTSNFFKKIYQFVTFRKKNFREKNSEKFTSIFFYRANSSIPTATTKSSKPAERTPGNIRPSAMTQQSVKRDHHHQQKLQTQQSQHGLPATQPVAFTVSIFWNSQVGIGAKDKSVSNMEFFCFKFFLLI